MIEKKTKTNSLGPEDPNRVQRANQLFPQETGQYLTVHYSLHNSFMNTRDSPWCNIQKMIKIFIKRNVEWKPSKNPENKKCWQEWRNGKLCTVAGNVKWCSYYGKWYGNYF